MTSSTNIGKPSSQPRKYFTMTLLFPGFLARSLQIGKGRLLIRCHVLDSFAAYSCCSALTSAASRMAVALARLAASVASAVLMQASLVTPLSASHFSLAMS